MFYNAGNISSTSIQLQWYKVLSDHQNGVILRYRIYYRPFDSNGTWNTTDVQENGTLLCIVDKLKMFTKYSFRISAFTSKGEGNVSESSIVSTNEDGKIFVLWLYTYIHNK